LYFYRGQSPERTSRLKGWCGLCFAPGFFMGRIDNDCSKSGMGLITSTGLFGEFTETQYPPNGGKECTEVFIGGTK
jgi:hypothetical protein